MKRLREFSWAQSIGNGSSPQIPAPFLLQAARLNHPGWARGRPGMPRLPLTRPRCSHLRKGLNGPSAAGLALFAPWEEGRSPDRLGGEQRELCHQYRCREGGTSRAQCVSPGDELGCSRHRDLRLPASVQGSLTASSARQYRSMSSDAPVITVAFLLASPCAHGRLRVFGEQCLVLMHP